MAFDVDAVRSQFPSLALGAAHFDGPGGSQTPASVAAAVAATMTAGLANRGSSTEAERRAEGVVVGARAAMADLLGADPRGVVFGRSMTQLTYDIARTLARGWGPGDEVVVTRLDHDADVRPWVQAAQAVGASVRWADPDRDTLELTPAAVEAVLGERTRLVAVTGASNLVGTRPDLPAIAGSVHAVGALLFVDGVHLAPHAPVDLAATGADLFACSPYKFFGPHLGVLAADPELLATLHPDKLLPSSDAVPERFELGTLPYELLAGTTAAVDTIAGWDPTGTAGSRRDRVLATMAAVAEHEARLFARMTTGLAALPGVTLHGCARRRTPTALFTVAGLTPGAASAALAARGVNAPAGAFYAVELSRLAGLGDEGGVRAGLSAYSDAADVDRILDGVGALVGQAG